MKISIILRPSFIYVDVFNIRFANSDPSEVKALKAYVDRIYDEINLDIKVIDLDKHFWESDIWKTFASVFPWSKVDTCTRLHTRYANHYHVYKPIMKLILPHLRELSVDDSDTSALASIFEEQPNYVCPHVKLLKLPMWTGDRSFHLFTSAHFPNLYSIYVDFSGFEHTDPPDRTGTVFVWLKTLCPQITAFEAYNLPVTLGLQSFTLPGILYVKLSFFRYFAGVPDPFNERLYLMMSGFTFPDCKHIRLHSFGNIMAWGQLGTLRRVANNPALTLDMAQDLYLLNARNIFTMVVLRCPNLQTIGLQAEQTTPVLTRLEIIMRDTLRTYRTLIALVSPSVMTRLSNQSSIGKVYVNRDPKDQFKLLKAYLETPFTRDAVFPPHN